MSNDHLPDPKPLLPYSQLNTLHSDEPTFDTFLSRNLPLTCSGKSSIPTQKSPPKSAVAAVNGLTVVLQPLMPISIAGRQLNKSCRSFLESISVSAAASAARRHGLFPRHDQRVSCQTILKAVNNAH